MTQTKQSLRVWLKLLTINGQVEKVVRGKLRDDHATTLPRFDVMATLDFAGDNGLSMGELSRRLMVSNGNVTGIVSRLEKEGLLSRKPDEKDRRTQWVKLTEAGKKIFTAQAKDHASWIEHLMHDMSQKDMDQLMNLLDNLRQSVERNQGELRP